MVRNFATQADIRAVFNIKNSLFIYTVPFLVQLSNTYESTTTKSM